MKLQGVAIIFIMITFPMILVLSYYLGMQIDTIKLQTSYDNKLIDATYDAMAAFEINTANEDLSQVSDSLRSIVNASATTFTNTLGTSLGLSNASKERIREYIPAVLFTLYDGYYIYAPTDVPKILEKFTINDDGIKTSEGAAIVGEETPNSTPTDKRYYTGTGGESFSLPDEGDDYGSLLYAQDVNNDGVVDNDYSTEINDDTKTKKDYVLKSYMPYSATYNKDINNIVTINYTLDNFMTISGTIDGVYYTKSGYYIEDNIEAVKITNQDDSTYEKNATDNDIEDFSQDYIKQICLESKDISLKLKVQKADGSDDIIEITDKEAATYYLTNSVFSQWVNDNLNWIKGICLVSNIIDQINENEENKKNEELYHNFRNDDINIFDSSKNPEEPDSEFNNHKYNIIKNSIQYNLNLAISEYNNMYLGSEVDFTMPQLTDNEWGEITSKISIVSFMQGLECGLKKYNGYSVISSTNNELTVIPEEIYYVGYFNDGISYYHRINCDKFNGVGDGVASFRSKEVKYDKIYNKHTNLYEYDHKNLACYECIVQNLKEESILEYIKNNEEKSKIYYTAVGKERQKLYKTIEYSKNEGVEVDNNPVLTYNDKDGKTSSVEITIEVIIPKGIIANMLIDGDSVATISTSTKSTQTIYLNLLEGSIDSGNIEFKDSDGNEISGNVDVLSIKYIYK